MEAAKIKHLFHNFLCSWVVSSYCKAGQPKKALDFFQAFRNRTSLNPNLVTYTAVLNSLSAMGDLLKVSSILTEIEQNQVVFDAVFYSTLIASLFRAGILHEPLKRHTEMVKRGIQPDSVSFGVLIHGLSEANEVEKAVGFLKIMKNRGLQPTLPSYTSLISGFCRKNKIQEAFSVLKLVKEESAMKGDELLYATLIHGLCKQVVAERFHKVYQLLHEMEMTPTIVTYNILINGLCLAGKTAAAAAISKKIHGDVVTYTTLLQAYTKNRDELGILETKRRVVEEPGGVQMDVIMCNVLIRALFMVGDVGGAREVYQKMKGEKGGGGLVPNSSTFYTLINGYFTFSMVDDAVRVFLDSVSSKSHSPPCYRRSISGLCAHGGGASMGMAVVVLAAFIKAHGSEEGTDCGAAVIRRLAGTGYTSCAYGLVVCARESASTLDVHDYGVVVHGLCRMGRVAAAAELCDLARGRGVAVNSIFGGLCRAGRTRSALELFDSLEGRGLVADEATYVTLVGGLCRGGDVDGARRVFDGMQAGGVAPDGRVYRSLVRGYSWVGRAEEARRVLMEFEGRSPSQVDEATLGCVIRGCCRRGDVDDAVRLFVEFRGKKKGLLPDLPGFTSLMSGLCLKGRVEESRSVMREMLQRTDYLKDRRPSARLLEFLCRRGSVEEAVAGLADSVRASRRRCDDGDGSCRDFDSFYSLVTSLCKTGEAEKANRLIQEMTCGLG